MEDQQDERVFLVRGGSQCFPGSILGMDVLGHARSGAEDSCDPLGTGRAFGDGGQLVQNAWDIWAWECHCV